MMNHVDGNDTSFPVGFLTMICDANSIDLLVIEPSRLISIYHIVLDQNRSLSDLCKMRWILLYSGINLRDCSRSRSISLAMLHAVDYMDLVLMVPSRSMSIYHVVLDQIDLAHSDLCKMRSILLYSEIDLRDCSRLRSISLAMIYDVDSINLIVIVPSRLRLIYYIVLDQAWSHLLWSMQDKIDVIVFWDWYWYQVWYQQIELMTSTYRIHMDWDGLRWNKMDHWQIGIKLGLIEAALPRSMYTWWRILVFIVQPTKIPTNIPSSVHVIISTNTWSMEMPKVSKSCSYIWGRQQCNIRWCNNRHRVSIASGISRGHGQIFVRW